jgi:hypothetical protein
MDERDVFGAQQQAAIEKLNVPMFADPLSKHTINKTASLQMASIF